MTPPATDGSFGGRPMAIALNFDFDWFLGSRSCAARRAPRASRRRPTGDSSPPGANASRAASSLVALDCGRESACGEMTAHTGLPLSYGGEPEPRASARGQLAGLRTCRLFGPFGRLSYLPPLPGLTDQCLLTTFVSAHRCGTVLDSHQVPFFTLGPVRNRETNRETGVSESARRKQADPIGV